ncbi:SusC/RagA family TonB-linked outer membrane protein [Gemmatimonadetes bacterium T265]|nr:SusC/RagA family TonB-linked outer membrane protein [Gemmatimonadetes bacterium T265]
MPPTFGRLLTAGAVAAAFAPAAVQAQQTATVTGRVTTAGTGAPVAAAQVSIGGSGTGAVTREDGTFSFTAPARLVGTAVTVTVRRIGFQSVSQQITLRAGANAANFTLTGTTTQLTGVVVTALGEQREKSTLGTAQTQVSSEELNTTYDPNIVNQLAGKVSGVQITGAGTQGGSSAIRIRGVTSLTGNNSPLFVVDGIPVSSNSRGGDPSGSTATTDPRGADYGSVIQDINPDDIATLTVLKGPNAAALYGSRAANGAILITTKKGLNGRTGVQATSNVTWDRPSILPKYQNLYAQGSSGEFQFVDGAGGGTQDGNDQSYGPRMDGRTTGCIFERDAQGNVVTNESGNPIYDKTQPCTEFNSNGKGVPLVPHPDNVYSFFNTGRTTEGDVAFSGGTSRSQARVSIGAQNVDGIIPNSYLARITTLANGAIDVTDQLSATASLSYIRNTGQNRPGTGYNTGILEQFVWFGRQVDMNALRTYYQPDGSLYNWNYNYHNNPFWQQYANPQNDERNRVIASGTVQYKFADWLNATLRSGVDNYRFGVNADYAKGNLNFGNLSYNGAFADFQDTYNETNTDLILNASHSFLGDRFAVTGLAGGSQRRLNQGFSSVSVNGLSVQNIYNVSNAAIAPQNGQNQSVSRINGVYGSGAVTYNRWWTLEGTARNDWSSTLPKGANSYFYPSVSTSFVLTEVMPALRNYGVSFAKIRGGIARVGNAADPYSLFTTYTGSSSQFAGLPLYSLGNTLANATLKPELTTSREVGAELAFLDNRITFDASYYHKFTRNQLINIVVSQTSGFTNKAINAGELSNHGFEALLSTTPVRQRDFEWTSAFNYSFNRAVVTQLYPGLQTIVLGGTWNATVEARVGEPYGTIRGYTILKDQAGNWLLQDGLPQRGPLAVLGNVQPKWVGGWNNTFRYKRFSLSALVDMHIGGNIFSVTNMFGEYTGVLANTTKGREVDWNNPGIVVKGIDQATGKPNTVNVTAENYYQSFFELNERYVYSDTWYKLRELRFAYDLPPFLTRRLRAQSANVAFVGRNLLTRTHVPNIDPEFAYTTGNYQGMEFAALPNARSLGFSIRITP